jgi:hypothetical protein
LYNRAGNTIVTSSVFPRCNRERINLVSSPGGDRVADPESEEPLARSTAPKDRIGSAVAIASRLRPRTVRARLALLCAAIVLLAGVGLLVLTFALGSHPEITVTAFAGRAQSGGIPMPARVFETTSVPPPALVTVTCCDCVPLG